VTPEAACFLATARDRLLKAQEMLENWPDEAGRASYLAAFHAAQALIFERTSRVVRSRSEVQAQFGRLVRKKSDRDAGLPLFLGRAYNLKVMADDAAESSVDIAPDHAALIVEQAGRVVEFVARSLVAGPPRP
jgi:uncharacterized protein (UPF0332 family)